MSVPHDGIDGNGGGSVKENWDETVRAGPVWSSAIFADLLGDAEIADTLSDHAVLDRYRRFETALLDTKRSLGLVSDDAAAEAIERLGDFVPEAGALAERTARDGVTIAGYVDQARHGLGKAAAQALHTGATSQDVMDTATILGLRDVNAILKRRLDVAIAGLDGLTECFGERQIMARTRMQAALPIKAKERLEDWQRPLKALATNWSSAEADILWLQLGGPVGDRRGFDGQGDAVAAELAKRLNLLDPGHAWHSDRRPVVAESEMLSRLTGALGKMGQDLALMAQNEIGEVSLSGTGGSSAMAHKSNPVAAEVLVTLARFNAGQLALLHGALVHEQERSGAAWTLEWLVLPQMSLAAGRALLLAVRLIDQIERIGEGG